MNKKTHKLKLQFLAYLRVIKCEYSTNAQFVSLGLFKLQFNEDNVKVYLHNHPHIFWLSFDLLEPVQLFQKLLQNHFFLFKCGFLIKGKVRHLVVGKRKGLIWHTSQGYTPTNAYSIISL